MTREPSSGTASQEINFWISLENALDSIDRQLKSDGVTLTLDVLRQAKRFHATVSFIADTGLKEAAEKVQKYNQLMREFPINELLSATSLDRLQEALVLIFGHLTKKLRISPYPIRRALPLVEAISGDLDAQLHNLLSGRRLMHYDYGEFEKLMNASDDVFRTWDDQLKEFTNVAREVTRKRSEKFIPIKIVPRHSATQERLQYLRTFRKAHEQLQRTVANVVEAHENATHRRGGDEKGPLLSESFGDMDAVGEVRQAYEALKDVDVLDLSPGKFLFVSFPPFEYIRSRYKMAPNYGSQQRLRTTTALPKSKMPSSQDYENVLQKRRQPTKCSASSPNTMPSSSDPKFVAQSKSIKLNS